MNEEQKKLWVEYFDQDWCPIFGCTLDISDISQPQHILYRCNAVISSARAFLGVMPSVAAGTYSNYPSILMIKEELKRSMENMYACGGQNIIIRIEDIHLKESIGFDENQIMLARQIFKEWKFWRIHADRYNTMSCILRNNPGAWESYVEKTNFCDGFLNEEVIAITAIAMSHYVMISYCSDSEDELWPVLIAAEGMLSTAKKTRIESAESQIKAKEGYIRVIEPSYYKALEHKESSRRGGIKGGRSRREDRGYKEIEDKRRKRAKEIKEKHPDWSNTSIAKQMERENLGNFQYLRQLIPGFLRNHNNPA